MDRRPIRLALATALIFLFESEARSEPIRFSYSYSVVRTTESPPHGTDVHFSLAPGGGPHAGQADIGAALPLAPLSIVTSGLPPEAPISIRDGWRFIGFAMHLQHEASGDQAILILGGELIGEVGYDTSTMVLKVSSLGGWAEARLGGYLYRMWLPDEVAVASWSAGSVQVSPRFTVSPIPTTEHAPEPSTLALGAAAAMGLASRRWLRRRAGAP